MAGRFLPISGFAQDMPLPNIDLERDNPEDGASIATTNPAVAMEQATVPPSPMAKDPPGGGWGEADFSFSDDIVAGSDADTGTTAYHLRTQGGGVPGVYQGGDNVARVGGIEPWKKAFEAAPEMAAQGMAEGAQATLSEGESMAAQYKRQAENAAIQAADIKRRRENDDEELRRRDEELKSLTQKYTQDLADTGQFWRKPQNILSAIAFSFMPLAGADPTAGLRLVDQAIQTDLKHRKDAANMHLGELRSNMSGYRQIARDREAGDLLAQSEAYRMAALETERIASSFKGAKAQAAAKVMVAELMQKSNLTSMEFFARLRYMQPRLMSALESQAIANQPGYTSYTGQPGKGQAQAQGGVQNAPQRPQGLGMQAMPDTATAPGMPRVDLTTKTGAALVRGLNPTGTAAQSYDPVEERKHNTDFEKTMGPEMAKLLESRLPGAARLVSQNDTDLRARAVLKLRATRKPVTPDAVAHEVGKILLGENLDGNGGITSKLPEIEKLVTADEGGLAGASRFQQDVRNLEAAFGGNKQAINDFIGIMRNFAPGWERQADELMAKAGVGDADQRNTRAAAMRFRQVLMGNVNSYFKETSGSAVSEHEQKRLNSVINEGAPWEQIKGFADDLSRTRAAKYKSAVMGAVPDKIAAHYYLIRKGQKYPTLNSDGKKPGG